jgi:glycine dehydrogenase subunit 1
VEYGKTYREIHEGLVTKGIHGGKYVGSEFPALGETALFCVTELHSKQDIDMLSEALEEAATD